MPNLVVTADFAPYKRGDPIADPVAIAAILASTQVANVVPVTLGNDPFFAYVVLLAHFNGTDGSQTVVDSSSYNRAATVSGAANLNAANAYFGSAAMYLSSISNGAYTCTWANSADWYLNPGDFTIEMWAYELTGSLGSLLSCRIGGQSFGWAMTTSSIRAYINGAWSDTQMTWTRPTMNAWHHYAWVRSGSTLYFFVDGTLVATKTNVTSMDDRGIGIFLGQSDNATENKFLGYIDEFRFTKKARYISNFTPTGPFPNA